MTLAKNGTRTIVVDGHRYRWRIRPQATYAELCGEADLEVAIEDAAVPGRLLIAFPGSHRNDGLTPAAVTPSVVAGAIRAAVRFGWDSRALGEFVLIRSDRREWRNATRCPGAGGTRQCFTQQHAGRDLVRAR